MSGTLTSIYPTLFDVTWLKSGTNISYTGGNVGIGTASPTAKLEIVGNMKLTDGSQGVGKILTSDANGLASWMALTNNLPSAFIGQTLRYDGSTWVANSNIYDDGLNVGIGTLSPLYKLEVAGKIGSYTTLSTDNDNTVTTKNYVDGRLSGLCTAMGGTWNNTTGICTTAVTYSWQLGTTYGACSVTCGGGTQTAPAVCKQNNGTIVADALCAGAKPAATSQSCNIQACAPVVNGSCNNSTQYACSAGTSASNVAGSCGGSSTWSCLGSGGGTNATSCSIANAACVPVVNGGWSAWGGGSCSVSCGGGTMTQTRTCNNPVPSGGGANCVGSSTQTISCNTQSCVVAVNGSCGGGANTCGAGSPSGYSAGSCGGSQTWSCLGSGGGSSASCSITNAACSCTHSGGPVTWGNGEWNTTCGTSI
jgi:Thrombospondin type 1 domain